MYKKNGEHCCYCDFCDESPCDGTPCSTVCFSNGYFAGSCTTHNVNLDTHIQQYLAAHPGVTVTEDDRQEDTSDELPTAAPDAH